MFRKKLDPNTIKDWTCIYESGKAFEADMIKNFLTDREIPAHILSKKDSAYSVNFSDLSLIYVYVPVEFEDKAKKALVELENAEIEMPDFDDIENAEEDDKN